MRALLVAAGTVLLTCAVPAQQSRFDYYGKGCPGSIGSGKYCLTSNPQGGALVRSTPSSYEFAMVCEATAPTVVTGFELFSQSTTNSPVNMQCHVLLSDTQGKPTGKPVRTATMSITPATAWHQVTFPPLLIQSKRFFLTWTPVQQNVMDPFVLIGKSSPYFYRPSSNQTWNGPLRSVAWTWRVLCTGLNAVYMGNTETPVIGKTFSIDLHNAKAKSVAVLALGASKTKWGPFKLPLDLTGAGAPGCSVLAAMHALMGAATDTWGKASISFSLPGDGVLLGVSWHNQWLVIDAAGNRLGVSFSDAATALVGAY